MKNYKVDTLILGATYYGCGLAKTIPGAVIVDSAISPGSDYAYAFDGGRNWDAPLKHAEAEEFRSELVERHALSPEGRTVIAGFTPVFAGWCIRHGVRPYFGLELAEKKGNTLKFIDFCGNYVTFEAKQLIDARSYPEKGRKFTAVVSSESKIADGKYGFFEIVSSNADMMYYVSFDVESDTSYQSARQRFAALWASRPAELADARLILTAARFSDNVFDNPAAALDAGLSGILPDRTIPDTRIVKTVEFDTVVCGAGTAGIVSVISAARKKLKVLAIDKTTYPGGVWTGGFIPQPYIQKLTGIASEIRELAQKREGYLWMSENLKMELEAAAIGCGATIWYETPFCGCEKEGNKVTAVICRDRLSGNLIRIKANTFIDATSEALLCRCAGAGFIRGREGDEEFNSYTNTMGIFHGKSFGAANFDAGRVAQYDFEDFSRCFLETCDVHLKDDYREFAVFVQVSDNPGLREGDRIAIKDPWTLGKYFASNGKCADTVFTVISNLDTHAQDIFFESENFQDWNIAASCWEIRISIPVPLKVLFPENVEGVIAPARHLGVDHDLGCAIRMISCLTALGELSGVIAAKAQAAGILPSQVKFDDVKDELPAHPEMSENETEKWGRHDLNAAWSSADDEKIIELLKSENPALGIWNIKQQNKADIARKIVSENAGTPAAYNAAFGLALLNDQSVIPLLKELVERDDRTPVNANLRYSAERRIAATYLLGRLRQADTADFLISQLAKRDCEKFFGHTVMALLKVGEANIRLRDKIGSVLKDIAEDTSWQMIEQLKGKGAKTRRSDGLLRLRIARTLDSWQIKHSIAEKMSSLKLDSHEAWLLKNYQR